MKILVLACDNNKDIFSLFHYCMEKYWPEHPEIIYSTETIVNPYYKTICKNYTLSNWTKRIREVVKEIDDQYILIMCDDIFLRQPVDNNLQASLPSYFNNNVASINYEINFDNTSRPINNLLSKRSTTGRYKTSVMCNLWQKDKLLKVLSVNPELDPWGFEKVNNHCNFDYYIMSDTFALNWGKQGRTYEYWGLVKGKITQETVKFFEKEGIDITELKNRRGIL